VKLRAIDLFCGAGGLSQGFRQAGFDIRLGVDFDEDACAAYRMNQPGANTLVTDLRQVSAADLLDAAGLEISASSSSSRRSCSKCKASRCRRARSEGASPCSEGSITRYL